jgi:hypothetical protein
MKCFIFRDTAPCSQVKIKRLLGLTYGPHLQGPRVSQAINQHEADSKQTRRQSSIAKRCLLPASSYHLTLGSPATDVIKQQKKNARVTDIQEAIPGKYESKFLYTHTALLSNKRRQLNGLYRFSYVTFWCIPQLQKLVVLFKSQTSH